MKILKAVKRFIHWMTTSPINLDKEIILVGEVRLTSTNLSTAGLCGYDINSRIVNRHHEERMVKIEKKGGVLYVDGKEVRLSPCGDFIGRSECIRTPLSASVSDFLYYNTRFIPLTWEDECYRQNARGVIFLGTTWVKSENHACRLLVPDADVGWRYDRMHDVTWCGEDGHPTDALSAYIEMDP